MTKPKHWKYKSLDEQPDHPNCKCALPPVFDYFEIPCECGRVFKLPYFAPDLRMLAELAMLVKCSQCGRLQALKITDLGVVH